MSKRGFGKFIIGAGIGAGIALLFAPKKGEELRQDLLAKASELLDKLKEVDTEEVKNNIEAKVKEIQDGIKDLDKEKVKKIAVEKAEVLKAKSEELVVYAKEKGTPVLEKAAQGVKDKAIEVLENTLTKLKSEEKAK